MLSEGQYQVRDLVLGEGTPYTVLSASNLWKRSVRADMTGDRPWSHGTWSGAEFADETVIPLSIMVAGDGFGGWREAHQALADAFRPVGTGGDVEFRFRIGEDERLMFGRPRMIEPDPENIGVGLARTQCAIVCPDPFIYSGDLIEFGPLTAPTWVGGLTFPVVFPVVFDSVLTGGEAVVTNAGTADAGMVLRIDGPCRTPSIQVESSGETVALSIDLEIDTGEWIDIDTDAHTVVLNGISNRRGDVFGVFPLIPPGDSTVRYRSEDEGGSMTGSLRSKWW